MLEVESWRLEGWRFTIDNLLWTVDLTCLLTIDYGLWTVDYLLLTDLLFTSEMSNDKSLMSVDYGLWTT